jgi:hypothetical protein
LKRPFRALVGAFTNKPQVFMVFLNSTCRRKHLYASLALKHVVNQFIAAIAKNQLGSWSGIMFNLFLA